jgi:hypothetical protein
MTALAKSFEVAMFDIYRRASTEIGYRPTLFLEMLTREGGLPTASEGYTRLWEESRLDLSVEAVVVDNPKWHPLFTEDEIARARARLLKYGYESKT